VRVSEHASSGAGAAHLAVYARMHGDAGFASGMYLAVNAISR
jgi:hypothetical protein